MKASVAHYLVLVDSNEYAPKLEYLVKRLGVEVTQNRHAITLASHKLADDAKITFIVAYNNYFNQFFVPKVHLAIVVVKAQKDLQQCQEIYDSYDCTKLMVKLYEPPATQQAAIDQIAQIL